MEGEKHRRAVRFERAAMALLLLAAGAVMTKTLLFGLEIDEQYALSIGYRLVKGDTLFGTMWEPHQLSALPAAVLVALYLAVTGGTTGILLFVRVVMLAAKASLSLWFYRALSPVLGRRSTFLAAVVLFVYTPKWFLGPDYISQQFHFTLAAFLCFWGYYAPGKKQFARLWLFVPGCVCLCLSFLAFPQSIFAAPVFFVGMLLLGRRRKEPRWLGVPRGAAALFLGCALCGGAFVAYVLSGVSMTVLLAHVGLILNDPQYDFSTAQRLALLLRQAKDVASFLAKPALAAFLAAAAGCVQGIRKKNIKNIRHWLNWFFFLWSLLTVALCLWRALRDASFDERYFLPVLVVSGAWFFRGGRGTVRELLFWLGYLPGVAAYLFILRSTLLGLAPTFMYLTWPAVCAVLAMVCQAREAVRGETAPTVPYALLEECPQTLLFALLVFLTVCRAWLILTTGWQAANVVNTPMEFLSTGPAAGTFADTDTAQMYHALETALAGHGGERVLVSTGDVEGLAFLMEDGTLEVGQASVISSTDSDSRFSAYYNELPEKSPQLILYNQNCIRDLDAFHAWLEENFTITGRTEVVYGGAALEVLTVAQ